jgi:hypothetical protein
LVLVLAAGCAGQDEQGTPAQRMTAWVQGTGAGSAMGTVLGDADRIEKVLALDRGVGAVHTDCGVLLTDAEEANSALPTPDGRTTRDLSDAYALEGEAANDCYNAGTTNQPLLDRSAQERAQAASLITSALARIRQITGTTVSTSTTTQPGGGGMFG